MAQLENSVAFATIVVALLSLASSNTAPVLYCSTTGLVTLSRCCSDLVSDHLTHGATHVCEKGFFLQI